MAGYAVSEFEHEREQAPVLLERLRERDPERAAWIEDVYSEVFYQLRQNDVKDGEFVSMLMEALQYQPS